ncbi:hypothetical protein [Mycobacteroides abscessus]|uniref:hypothetical protein n=1 Tax=Mycobacteroides abscessus TaxID=36809 RepID=UPI00105588B2|nr:hypothetical protein [Mycobacteroides abscessus]
MASEIMVAAISGGTGLAAGIVGSLFAPWANWGIEKRRLRRASRVERIEEWRAGAYQLDGDVYFMELEWSPWYATLRPEMSAATKKNIDAESQDVPNPNYNEVRMLIINEIARIEREKWKLA